MAGASDAHSLVSWIGSILGLTGAAMLARKIGILNHFGQSAGSANKEPGPSSSRDVE